MKKLFSLFAILALSLSMVAQSTVVESPATDAHYRIPMKKGAVAVTALAPVNWGVAMHLNQVGFCAWEFSATKKCDVVAPREGVVESAGEGDVLILHPDGLYTSLQAIGSVVVKAGDKVEKGDKVGTAGYTSEGVWRVWMAVYHLKSNPGYGTTARSGNYEHLVQYVDPIFVIKGKNCETLTDGGTYTVKARTWSWPWE